MRDKVIIFLFSSHIIFIVEINRTALDWARENKKSGCIILLEQVISLSLSLHLLFSHSFVLFYC